VVGAYDTTNHQPGPPSLRVSVATALRDGSRRPAGSCRRAAGACNARIAARSSRGSTTGVAIAFTLEHARLLRAWAGLCDLSPDYSPTLGKTEVDNFNVSAGWGTYGFKAAPIVGKTLAELVATGRTADRIAPFELERFYRDEVVSELAAAAVGH
jgi:hypothetical protein